MQCSDFIGLICDNMDTIQHLVALCLVNKQFKATLYSVRCNRNWIALGKKVCGEKFWPTEADLPAAAMRDARRLAAACICPWTSRPLTIKVEALEAAYSLRGCCSVTAMQFAERSLCLKMRIEPESTVIFDQVKEFAAIVNAETCVEDNVYQHVQSLEEMPFPAEPMTDEEDALLKRAVAHFVPSVYLNHPSKLLRAHLVNQAVVALVFYWDGSDASILFCATKDLRILRNMPRFISLIKEDRPCVVFRPGQMWTLSDDVEVEYRNPLQPVEEDVPPSHRLDDVFDYVCRGRVGDAIARFSALGLPLTTRSCIKGLTMMHLAVMANSPVAVVLLAHAGLGVDELSDSLEELCLPASCIAGKKDDCTMLLCLIEQGADVNMQIEAADNGHKSLLHHGIEFGWNAAMILLLVSKGADANIRASDGTTPLFEVAERMGSQVDSIDITKILCAAGADVNARAADRTILCHWMKTAFVPPTLCQLVPILCQLGCDVDARSGPEQRTPLMEIMDHYSSDVIQMLVEGMDADVTLRDANGRTALDIFNGNVEGGRKLTERAVRILKKNKTYGYAQVPLAEIRRMRRMLSAP
jgi:ankyrin repeat protein